MSVELGATTHAAIPVSKTGMMWGVILTCAAVAILEGFDIQAIGIAAPKLVPALHLSPEAAGRAFGLGQFGLVAGTLLGGWLSDKIGRKAMLLMSVILFGIFTLITPFVHSFEQLVAVRVATGLGLGGAMPNMIRMALDAATARNRAFTVTMVMAGTPLGGALVSLFARLYMPSLGWQSLFILGGVLPLLLIVPILLLPKDHKAQLAGRATARINAVSALFGDGRWLTTLLFWAASLLTLIVLYLFLNWLPSLMGGLGLPAKVGQDASLAFNLGSVVGALSIGFITDRMGARGPLSLAYVGLIAAVAGLAFLRDVNAMLISAAFCGFFELGAQYALAGVGAMYYPSAARGLGTGAALAAGRVGSIIGPIMAGEVLGAGFGASGVLMVLVPVALLAGICVFWLTGIGRTETE